MGDAQVRAAPELHRQGRLQLRKEVKRLALGLKRTQQGEPSAMPRSPGNESACPHTSAKRAARCSGSATAAIKGSSTTSDAWCVTLNVSDMAIARPAIFVKPNFWNGIVERYFWA